MSLQVREVLFNIGASACMRHSTAQKLPRPYRTGILARLAHNICPFPQSTCSCSTGEG